MLLLLLAPGFFSLAKNSGFLHVSFSVSILTHSRCRPRFSTGWHPVFSEPLPLLPFLFPSFELQFGHRHRF